MRRALRYGLGIAVACTPATGLAQSPTAPPHPTMPWTGITTPYGQLIRYVYMAPQSVTLEYLVAGPAPTEPPAPDGETKPGEPPAEPPTTTPTGTPLVLRQPITIPGYYVRETTAGYYYPERWTIEQTGVNAYRWRMLPAQVVPK